MFRFVFVSLVPIKSASSFSCESSCQCLLRLAARQCLAFAGSATLHLKRTLRLPSLEPSAGCYCSFWLVENGFCARVRTSTSFGTWQEACEVDSEEEEGEEEEESWRFEGEWGEAEVEKEHLFVWEPRNLPVLCRDLIRN